jgi:hypothetical protein
MKKTITKTTTEVVEIEVIFPMYVKDNHENADLCYYYALFEDEMFFEVAVGKRINGIKFLHLPIDRYIDLPQITEKEFLKAYAEANSVNVLAYKNAFNKSNEFIEMVSGGNEE